jgi:hypothetical protein
LYPREGGHREAGVTQRYSLVEKERDDYKKYTCPLSPDQSPLVPLLHGSISQCAD